MDSELNDLLLTKYFVVKSQIDSVSSRTIFLKKNVREYRGYNQKWAIQRKLAT